MSKKCINCRQDTVAKNTLNNICDRCFHNSNSQYDQRIYHDRLTTRERKKIDEELDKELGIEGGKRRRKRSKKRKTNKRRKKTKRKRNKKRKTMTRRRRK